MPSFFVATQRKSSAYSLNFGRTVLVEAEALSPSEIGSLQLWLDTTVAASLEKTSTGGGQSGGGDFVGRWTDQASGLQLIQGTGGSLPTKQNAVQNGLPVVRFDGTNDTLAIGTTSLMRNDPGATVAFVFKNETGSSFAAAQRIFYLSTNVSGSSRCNISINTTPAFNVSARRLDSDSAQSTSVGSADDTTFHILMVVFNYTGDLATVYMDNVSIGTMNPFQSGSTGQNTSDTNSARFALASGSTSSTDVWGGDLGDVIIHTKALSTQERNAEYNYLKNKWGL